MEKKMELLQSWFQEGCSFRVQFEKAADIFWQQPVGGNSIPRNWKTFKEMNVHLIALYNCPGEAPFPRQAPQFIDLLSIWGYCAEIPDHHHRLAFIWFKQLSHSYAKCVEWDAPQFKSADAIYGPLPGNSPVAPMLSPVAPIRSPNFAPLGRFQIKMTQWRRTQAWRSQGPKHNREARRRRHHLLRLLVNAIFTVFFHEYK